MQAGGAIVLYGRGTFHRKPDVAALRATLELSHPDRPLRMASEDLTGPALPEVLRQLAAEGVREVTVLPCGLPPDVSLTRWLPGALNAFRLAETGGLTIRIARPLEEFLDLGAALRAALADPDKTDVATVPPAMGKPGWSEIPVHGRQIFFCTGARCAHRGAHGLWLDLRRAMRGRRELARGAARVMSARSSCLFPCNLGPLMIVQPEGIWYGGLTPDLIARIVEEHLIGGRPVETAIVHRQPGPPPGD